MRKIKLSGFKVVEVEGFTTLIKRKLIMFKNEKEYNLVIETKTESEIIKFAEEFKIYEANYFTDIEDFNTSYRLAKEAERKKILEKKTKQFIRTVKKDKELLKMISMFYYSFNEFLENALCFYDLENMSIEELKSLNILKDFEYIS